MDKNFTSGASSVTVQYSVTGNCQDKVSFTKEGDFISTSKTSTSITISASENRGEARTGHVYTYYDGTRCDNNTITITQTAGPCIPAQVSYQYNSYSGSVEACDTSETVTVSGEKTTTYADPSCEPRSEQITTRVTLNFDKNTSSDERTIQSSFTINNSNFTVLLTQPGGCDESDKYLTIKSMCDDNKIYFKTTNSATTKTISASTDNGGTWREYTIPSGESETLITTLDNNEKIWLKGSYIKCDNIRFTSSGEYELYGNIMSLIYSNVLEANAFNGLFSQSTKLKKAENLILPTKVSQSCYQNMFNGCTSLTTAPVLPATTLAESCYSGMFNGCTSLIAAPELPATGLRYGCYMSMFYGCTSLTTAPSVLPATELKDNCYRNMFRGCTSLTRAPGLSATTLAQYCYGYMFQDCTSLTTAPELSATTLANYCYAYMFRGCTNLVKAPELPATTLAANCYSWMFHNCTSLNSITCLATDISASNCTSYWVDNVSATGTFTKAPGMTGWERGSSAIPNDWTVEDAQ